MTRTSSGPSKSPLQQLQSKSRSIKKAYVRFDDYLDLNEENMRRSCKRLMNKLYHEPGADTQLNTDNDVEPVHLTTLPGPKQIVSKANSQQAHNSNPFQAAGNDDYEQSEDFAIKNRMVNKAARSNVIVASSTEKSYLRSQYERRQKRQIELMVKRQQQQVIMTKNQAGAGAGAEAEAANFNPNEMLIKDDADSSSNNISKRQHQVHQQQDMVARSHELSKRRFFEKLQRESMKNSTSSTQDWRQVQNFKTTKQVPCNNIADDQLMMKVYQSIVSIDPKDSQPLTHGSTDFHTQMRPWISKSQCCKLGVTVPVSESLIEFPNRHQDMPVNSCHSNLLNKESNIIETPVCRKSTEDCSLGKVLGFDASLSNEDSSVFEIKVPEHSSYCAQDLNNCTIDKLLIVRQVNDAMSQSAFQCGCNIESNNEINLYQATDQSAAQSEPENCSTRDAQEIKETTAAAAAAAAALTKNPCKSDHARQCKKTIIPEGSFKVEQQCDDEEKVISSTINTTDQESVRDEVRDREAAEMKRESSSLAPESGDSAINKGSRQTTLESASDKNNAAAEQEHELLTSSTRGSDVQLVNNNLSADEASMSPETSSLLAELFSADATENQDERIGNTNEAIEANYEHTQTMDGAISTAQVQQVSETTIDEKNSAIRTSESEAFTDADEAASLETIITNKRETRDVQLEPAVAPNQSNATQMVPQHQQTPPSSNFERRKLDQPALGKSTDDEYATRHQLQPLDEEGTSKLEEIERPVDREEVSAPQQQLKQYEFLGGLSDDTLQPLETENKLTEQRGQDLSRFEEEQYANSNDPSSRRHADSNPENLDFDSIRNNVQNDQYGSCRGSSSRVNAKMHSAGSKIDLIARDRVSSFSDEPLQHELFKDIRKNINKRANQRGDVAKVYDGKTSNRSLFSSSASEDRPDEDVDSSCSSSGFGASVSATSSACSSDGHQTQASMKDNITADSSTSRQDEHYRRPNPSAFSHKESIYDSIRPTSFRAKANVIAYTDRRTAELKDYRHVGPDQAYPSQMERPLLVENHGYASLANRCQKMITAHPLPSTIQRDESRQPLSVATDESEFNFCSNGHYANMLTTTSRMHESPIVGYATVREQSSTNPRNSANIPPTENKSHSTSQTDAHLHQRGQGGLNSTAMSEHGDCASSLKGHSISTSSASTYSGGFSKLPPVRLIDHNFANTLNSAKAPGNNDEKPTALVDDAHAAPQQSKRSSLLKRFGHLVSMAFASPGTVVNGVEDGVTVSEQFVVNHYGINSNLPTKSEKRQDASAEQNLSTPKDNNSRQLAHRATEYASSKNNTEHEQQERDSLCLFNSPIQVAVESLRAKHIQSASMVEADLVILPTKHSKLQPKDSALADYKGATTLRLNRGFNEMQRNCQAISDNKLDRHYYKAMKSNHHVRQNKESPIECLGGRNPSPLVYSSMRHHSRSLHLDQELCRFNTDDGDMQNEELIVNDGKCQSLNLYQNLLRNVKRRHRYNQHIRGHHQKYHHHHQHHNHSAHHHHKHSSSSQHDQYLTSRRGLQQQCTPLSGACSSDNCSSSSCELEQSVTSSGTQGAKANVWGQLIKINKSDGSQVIELQRASGRSWGFFVARGAINNIKGDRILSIDSISIEPDFDIFRVNQMISKKSKILLKVKPFKG